jgi:hypothetical protein
MLIVVLPDTAMSQETKVDHLWTFAFCLQNDWLFGQTDRYYTSGLRLSWTSPDISGAATESGLKGWGNSISEWLLFMKEPELRRSGSFSIGQNMYTPEDINRSDLIREDRPYAGVTYAAVGFHAIASHRMESVELLLGIVNPHSYAGELQEKVHEFTGSTVPHGWDNQLDDEPIVNIFYERTWKLLRSGTGRGLGYDVLPSAGGALGNGITAGSAGVQARLGWNLPNDFGVSRIHPGLDSSTTPQRQGLKPVTDSTEFGCYVFAALNGMAVAQNIVLDGNTFTDSHSVDKKALVADLTLGFSVTIGRLGLSYASIYQTREFEGQRDNQKFGSITFSYFF